MILEEEHRQTDDANTAEIEPLSLNDDDAEPPNGGAATSGPHTLGVMG